jgi:CRISPR-associated exonuclease Cas4
MFTEDKLLPISALQHLAFCERQWALIHLEGVWEENRLTVEGHQLHDRVHEDETEMRRDLLIARGLRLRSLRLGLTGKADMVEFHRLADAEAKGTGIHLEGVSGLWKPLIVEYKHGKPKLNRCDEVQLCAQALCLEEMLAVPVPTGVLFYGQPRRRYDVLLDETLRQETESLIAHLHEMSESEQTPSAEHTGKCTGCSLIEVCLPKVTGGQKDVHKYLTKVIAETEANTQ